MTDERTLSLIEAAETAVRVAVTAQRETADPTHEQFYAWGGALSDMLGRLAHVCDVLEGQIAHYGDRRVLRDDQEQDPIARLGEMVAGPGEGQPRSGTDTGRPVPQLGLAHRGGSRSRREGNHPVSGGSRDLTAARSG